MRNHLLSTFGVTISCSLVFYACVLLFEHPLNGCLILTVPFYAISTAICFHLKRKDDFDDLINHSLMGILVLFVAAIASTFLFLAAGILVPVITIILYSVFLRYRYKLDPNSVSVASTLIAILNLGLIFIFGHFQLHLTLMMSIAIALSGLFPFLVFRKTYRD